MIFKILVMIGSSLSLLFSLPALQESLQATAPVSGIEGGRLVDVRSLEGTLYHVQGVDLDREHIYVTSVDKTNHKGYLHLFNRATAEFERQVDLTDGPRFHAGGFSIHGDSIWVPVAEYRPHSTAVLEEIDKRTLVVKRKIPVPDHLGCLAVTNDSLIAGNWNSLQFYIFDLDGKQLRMIDNPSANQYQDIKFVRGQIVASGNIGRGVGSVDWYSWPSMTVVRSARSGLTDRGKPYTGEGMALQGDDLYLLPEDGPSRIFHFSLSKR